MSADDQTVALRPLSVVTEDGEVLLGDPETGTFVAVPPVGGVLVNALLAGMTVQEAAAEAERFAGEPVDVPSFVETLRELGFVEDGPLGERHAVRTAPLQNTRWVSGVSERFAKLLFGRVAWTVYATCGAFSIAVFAGWPALFPDPTQDAFIASDIGLSTVLLVPFAMVSTALHEIGHWLAARALGLEARFGVDRRMVLLVFETDLTQIWTLPRRRRYGPLLGGLAIDAVLLALLVGARLLVHLAVWQVPPIVDDTLAVWTLVKLAGILWQCMIFLRTDLYAVLVNALGCRELWRVKSLMLRQAFGRLTTEQAAELDGAAPADIRAGRWFRWVWLAGFAGVAAWFAGFMLPAAVVVMSWTAEGVALGPAAGRFWYCLVCAALLLGPLMFGVALAVKERLQPPTAL